MVLRPEKSTPTQVMHPPSTGSHVKTLFRVTEAMVARGHRVTTVRYEMIQGIRLPFLQNHTEIVLAINNTDGRVPFVTKVGRMGIGNSSSLWNSKRQR